MTSRQESKLSMYSAVSTFCNNNAATVSTVLAFQNALGDFDSKLISLRSAIQAETEIIIGIAKDKTELRRDLCNSAAGIAASIFAYATTTGSNELKEQVRYSVSDLIRLKDELLAPACNNIHAVATANLAALADYGITNAKLVTFSNDILNYSSKVPAPRNAVSDRAAQTAIINTLFKEMDDILKERMDKLALLFKSSHAAFYTAYVSNRVIVDAPTSPTKLEGNIKGGPDSDPVAGATVSVEGTPFETTTDGLGDFSLAVPDPGTYNIKVTAAGFEDYTQNNVVITLGNTTDFNATLTLLPR